MLLNLGNHYAANNLRNRLAKVMRHTICPKAGRRDTPIPEHAADCPACWLLSAQLDPSTVFRVYAIVPPQPPRHQLDSGKTHLAFSGLDFVLY